MNHTFIITCLPISCMVQMLKIPSPSKSYFSHFFVVFSRFFSHYWSFLVVLEKRLKFILVIVSHYCYYLKPTKNDLNIFWSFNAVLSAPGTMEWCGDRTSGRIRFWRWHCRQGLWTAHCQSNILFPCQQWLAMIYSLLIIKKYDK